MVLGVNAIYLLIVKDDNNFGQIMLNNLVEMQNGSAYVCFRFAFSLTNEKVSIS